MSTQWREIAAQFDARAQNYGRNDWHRSCANRLVDLCRVDIGSHVLDAGTGTGFAALALARAVGPAGRVVAVDISPGMLREARRAVEEAGFAHVELLERDATSLAELGPGTLDVVTCVAALLYMPVGEALREWHRLLRPGGIIAFSTMRAGSPAAGRIFRQCATNYGLLLADPSEALGSEASCRLALSAAGFNVVSIVGESVKFSVQDHALAWESNFKSSGHAAVQGLSAEDQRALKTGFLAAMAQAAEARPGELDRAHVIYAIGQR